LEEQRQKRDHEDEEDGHDAALDPQEYRFQIITSSLATNELTRTGVPADGQMAV
jgi:hypothetical protein